jgi:hypothetical protein
MTNGLELTPALLSQLVNMLKADIAMLSAGDWKKLNQTVAEKAQLYDQLRQTDAPENALALGAIAQEGLALAAEAQLRLNIAVDAVRNRLHALNEALGYQPSLAYHPSAVFPGKARSF